MQESNSGKSLEHHIFRIVGCFNSAQTKTFPSLNEYIRELGRNPKAGGRMKKKYEQICIGFIRKDLKGWKTTKPFVIHYRFFEPSSGKKRDYGNILGMAQKIIEDALQMCGTIPNDNPRYLTDFTHEFNYTNGTPYIEVEIEEV